MMKRNEFIFKLAVENKLAFVDEDVHVLRNDDLSDTSEPSLSPTSDEVNEIPRNSGEVNRKGYSLTQSSPITISTNDGDSVKLNENNIEMNIEQNITCGYQETDLITSFNGTTILDISKSSVKITNISNDVAGMAENSIFYNVESNRLHLFETDSTDLNTGVMHQSVQNSVSVVETGMTENFLDIALTENSLSRCSVNFDKVSVDVNGDYNTPFLSSQYNMQYSEPAEASTSTLRMSPISIILESESDDDQSYTFSGFNSTDSENEDDDTDKKMSKQKPEPILRDHSELDDNHSSINKDFSKQSQKHINNKEHTQDHTTSVVRMDIPQEPINKLANPYTSSQFGINQQYIKKASARERPTICPLCYKDVVTHFPRHLFRYHQDNTDVQRIQSLKPGSSERTSMISALRKQGYFHLNTEKNILHPVRSSKNADAEKFVCTFCLGFYTKKLLYRHVKQCKNKPADITNPGRNCLTNSQTFLASVLSKNNEFLNTSRIKNEVFGTMRADNISELAKTDPLICLYGETLLAKHKRQQIATVVSSRIREMAKLLIVLKSINNYIHGLFDALKPETFKDLISATKIISGYNPNKKTFKAASLALHMGTSLKMVCNVAFKIVVEKRKLSTITWTDRDAKKNDIKDLRKLIEAHWCTEIASLALKDLKEKQWKNPTKLPSTSDILAFQTYVNGLAENAYEKLNNNIDIKANYKILTECVLALTVMFNRKRIGDVQYLLIETYNTVDQKLHQEAFTESLTSVEKLLSRQFKRVVTGGKGSKPIAILFSKRMQQFIKSLIKVRENSELVPKSNSYLFANPGSDKWMAGTSVIRRLSKNCGAKQPLLLTSTRFRKHIATTLQLMSMEADEMEQIATFMGHTTKTHSEFYRLPQDIYQTAKVAKVLLLLEQGKGKEFQGKSLNDIELDSDVFYDDGSDASEHEKDQNEAKLQERNQNTGENKNKVNKNITGTSRKRTQEAVTFEVEEMKENLTEDEVVERAARGKRSRKQLGCNKLSGTHTPESHISSETESTYQKEEETASKKQGINVNPKKISSRTLMTPIEKSTVLKYFGKHIKNKVTPRRYECDEFLKKHGSLMENKDWVKIKTLVYNFFRSK